METFFITFRSVTYAQKGEQALKTAGIDCFLQRTPRWMEAKGCGYAVKVGNVEEAAAILSQKGAKWEKIYRICPGKAPKVMEL